MEKSKGCLRKMIESIFKKIDIFGVSFSFKYKSDDKYSTVVGGIVTLFFVTISIIYSVINCRPFFQRKNFTLFYYTTNLEETESVKLKSSTSFAIGLDCPISNMTNIDIIDLTNSNNITNIGNIDNITNKVSKDNITNINNLTNLTNITNIRAEDLFDKEFLFITNDKKKIQKKNSSKVLFHDCTDLDFNNVPNNSFDYLHIDRYQCLNKSEEETNNLKGIYTDEVFSYYEFSVKSKYKNNKTHFNLINKYLIENDCKLQFYYTDIIVDLKDFKKPIKSFMNSLFLQMNPILIQKKNVFFMNYHLIYDKKYLHVLEEDEDEKDKITTGFSRVEDYSIFAGLNRYSENSPDKDIYAKLYIRVDNKEVTIKRKYQDIMEFYADCSSLLLSVFWLLCIIMGIIEKVKAKHSIGKKLFFLKE